MALLKMLKFAQIRLLLEKKYMFSKIKLCVIVSNTLSHLRGKADAKHNIDGRLKLH
jgi:hypothetical protein